MTYSPNIPQATDDPSQSQSLILQNFQQINSQYGTLGDHVAFTAASNNGKHNKATLINQVSQPTSLVNEVVVYSNTQSGITDPYYVRDNLSTVFPLAPIKAFATFQNAAGAITPLNSWNITSINNAAGTITITMTRACKTASSYGVIANSQNIGGPTISVANLTSTSFQLTTAPGLSIVTVMVLES